MFPSKCNTFWYENQFILMVWLMIVSVPPLQTNANASTPHPAVPAHTPSPPTIQSQNQPATFVPDQPYETSSADYPTSHPYHQKSDPQNGRSSPAPSQSFPKTDQNAPAHKTANWHWHSPNRRLATQLPQTSPAASPTGLARQVAQPSPTRPAPAVHYQLPPPASPAAIVPTYQSRCHSPNPPPTLVHQTKPKPSTNSPAAASPPAAGNTLPNYSITNYPITL